MAEPRRFSLQDYASFLDPLREGNGKRYGQKFQSEYEIRALLELLLKYTVHLPPSEAEYFFAQTNYKYYDQVATRAWKKIFLDCSVVEYFRLKNMSSKGVDNYSRILSGIFRWDKPKGDYHRYAACLCHFIKCCFNAQGKQGLSNELMRTALLHCQDECVLEVSWEVLGIESKDFPAAVEVPFGKCYWSGNDNVSVGIVYDPANPYHAMKLQHFEDLKEVEKLEKDESKLCKSHTEFVKKSKDAAAEIGRIQYRLSLIRKRINKFDSILRESFSMRPRSEALALQKKSYPDYVALCKPLSYKAPGLGSAKRARVELPRRFRNSKPKLQSVYLQQRQTDTESSSSSGSGVDD